VREAFFELQEEERMILGMHIFLGYRTREIAAQLSMNENTVRSRESRALQKLKRSVLPDT
jgi:RNA polymerase sigma-70 factor (ECF subfamily)